MNPSQTERNPTIPSPGVAHAAQNSQTVPILLFAGAAEIVGVRRLPIQVATCASMADIRAALCRLEPRLAHLAMISRWAVGNEFVNDDYQLPELTVNSSLEIAMIPPVSGG